MSDDILKVFILEDMPVDLELIKRRVRGYRPEILFSTARDRAEFERKVVSFQPDLVLSDYNLPDMNGLNALLHVRQHLDATPFIFITGILNDEEKVAEAILNGASGYLLKDHLDQLPALLRKVMTQHRSVLEEREKVWEKRREHQIKLRKSIAELRSMSAPGADQIASSLQEVADDLS